MPKLIDVLDGLTVAGELCLPEPDGAVRCTACGHRCLIRPGRRGICQVRFNEGGKLRVPWGYVTGLQADPVEKKPFYHILPGATALTFGMLGCDFHCGYCFSGDTIVLTNHGPLSLEQVFNSSETRIKQPDGEISYPEGLMTVTESGNLRKVRAVFKHPYQGNLVAISPYYLPALHCTPDHRVYATNDISQKPTLIRSDQLTPTHYLAVPRQFPFSSLELIDAAHILNGQSTNYRVHWKLTREDREMIVNASQAGFSSRQIGREFGKSASYIRKVRSKLNRGGDPEIRTKGIIIQAGILRFPKEHRPGIPTHIPLTQNMASLLGYYCSEGSVVKDCNRPNSLVLNFSFSPTEKEKAGRVKSWLEEYLGVSPYMTEQPTSLRVSANKSSAALLFENLAGRGAANKCVPSPIFDSSRLVVKAFLDAYVDGDGHRYENGKVSATTVSISLAYGVAWLALKLGYLPSIYDAPMPPEGNVQGRRVTRSSHQYTIVWYEKNTIPRKAIQTDRYFLVPLRSIEIEEFDGSVFNMEVEEEHKYLAGFFLVSNCQNWLTSQAVRDPAADESIYAIRRITPEQVVETGRRTGAEVIASSYNEPLITSEWAAATFKLAAAAGMKCIYVSNGNATPEVLEYLRPYLTGMKIDLKSMQDKHYRQMGGVLKNVLDTIRRVHQMGLWVEVVTLVVPGFNDSNEELWDAARFLTSVSADIPWHVTAFHPDYKMTDPDPTPARTLLRAAEIGREAGLHYVYAGNLPGQVEEYETTYCPKCNTPLVVRSGYYINKYLLTAQGTCPQCHTPIPGVWPGQAGGRGPKDV